MRTISLLIPVVIALFIFQFNSFGQVPNLGSTSSFALFTANGAFTNVGASVVTGDVGTNVGAYTAFPPGTLVGQSYLPGSPQADQAATDVATAYNALNSIACTTTILPELGGQTLTPGVYCQNTATATSLNGTLTLSGAGLFIIKSNSALTTATNSSIVLINGASIDNVFFQVNGAVDVGIGATFRGTILANGAISLLTGASLDGRGLSIGGAISLNDNIVTNTSLSLSAVAGTTDPGTNTYAVSGAVSLTNATTGTATITDGTATTTVSITGGDTSIPYSLTGLTSGTGSHTVTVSYASHVSSATYTAPTSISAAPSSLGGIVFVDNNSDGIKNGSDSPLMGVVVTLLNSSSSPIASTTATSSGTYSFTGLTSGTPYSLSFTTPTGYTTTTGGITGPITLTSGENNSTVAKGFVPLVAATPPALSVQTFSSLSKAKVGDLVTYTVVVTNTGSSSASTTVRDSISSGATYVASSVSAPAGTSFTPGQPVSLWTIPSIAASQSLTLTFQVTIDSTGIIYSIVTVPGDTTKTCTSIPVKMCIGDEYTLTVPAGRASYKWYKDGVLIPGQSSNVLVVSAPGSYSLGVDNIGGLCPDFSCCPFIVEEDSLPAFQAVAIGATCLGNTAQSNGKLVLSGFNPTHTYQYSLGATFNPAASLSGGPQVISATGVITASLANPLVSQLYTIRVYNSSGCFTDMTVMLLPTVCGCPADICVPFFITQTKRPARIGDPVR